MEQEGHSILVVHGRDHKPDLSALAEISFDAMRSGLERDYPDSVSAFDVIDRDFAYYGDLTNEFLARFGSRYDEALDVGDRRNALAALKEINARKHFGIRDYDRVAGKSALKEFAADIVGPLGGLFGFGMFVLRRVSRDFAEYLGDSSAYSEAVRERVRDKLIAALERRDKLMLISHGTGSVVTWDALWELTHVPEYSERLGDVKVDQWITMGSPLGGATVKKYIRGAKQPDTMRFPGNVITWQNLAAEDDYVSHDKSVADDYKRMMDRRLVSQIRDYRIFNLAVRYGKSNPHSSVGYYIHPRLSKILADWLAGGSG